MLDEDSSRTTATQRSPRRDRSEALPTPADMLFEIGVVVATFLVIALVVQFAI